MAYPSDEELQTLVKQVIQRTLGKSALGFVSVKQSEQPAAHPAAAKAGRKVALGADHGGFSLKENLKYFLQEKGYFVEDCGTFDQKSVDYPDFAAAVARKVASGDVWRGIVIDGAGIGSCMAANKIKGVRAAMCYDYATAVNSREHNNANVLALGAGLLGENLVKQIVEVWLNTPFGGGRHTRRVNKMMALEK